MLVRLFFLHSISFVKKFTLVLMLCILPNIFVAAQNISKVDSLKSLLETNDDNVNTYVQLSKELLTVSIDESIRLAKKAEELSFDHQDASKLPSIYRLIAQAYLNKQSSDSAKIFYLKSIAIASSQSSSINLAFGNSGLAKCSFITYELDSARKYLDRAWDYSKKNESIELKAELYLNEGRLLLIQALYSGAINYFLKSIKLYEKINNSSEIYDVHSYLGVALMSSEFYEDAKVHLEKALNYYLKFGRADKAAYLYNYIGYIYEHTGNPDGAFLEYLKALEIFREQQNKKGIAGCLYNMGRNYMDNEEYEIALFHLKEALVLDMQMGDLYAIASDKLEIGDIYKIQKQCDSAEYYLLSGYQTAHESYFSPLIISYEESISNYYAATNENEQALVYYKKHIASRNSSFDSENKDKISKLLTELEYRLEEHRIVLVQEKNILVSQNRRLIIGILFIIIAILFIIYLFFRRRNLSERRMMEQDSLITEKEQKIIKIENEKERYEIEKLSTEVLTKKRAMISYVLSVIEKNDAIGELLDDIEDVVSISGNKNEAGLSKLKGLINQHFVLKNHWDAFNELFNSVFVDYKPMLKKEFPKLTDNDLRLCSLIKLDLDMADCSRIMHLSPGSVKISRHRLRKKLELETTVDLNLFLLTFGEE